LKVTQPEKFDTFDKVLEDKISLSLVEERKTINVTFQTVGNISIKSDNMKRSTKSNPGR